MPKAYILHFGEANLKMAILNLNIPKGLRIYHIGECDLEPVNQDEVTPAGIPALTLQWTDLTVPQIAKYSPKSLLSTGNNTWPTQKTLFFGIRGKIIRDGQDVGRRVLPATTEQDR